MGILSRLWREVWEAEQRQKTSIADRRFAEQVKDAELSRQAYNAIPTRLQTYAEQHGATPVPEVVDMGFGISNQMASTQHNLTKHYTQALQQSMQALNTLHPTPSQNTYTTTGYVTGQLPSIGHIYRHLGNLTRDTLFLALKGVEEAAMKAPKGNHPYDDQAVKLLDMRNFNGESVDMLQLCSFCVSNCYEPEPLIKLLEGSGIEVKA